MGTPTRFSGGGVTNAAKGQLLGGMGQLDPLKFNTFFEDFNARSDIVAATPLDWTVTKVGTGAITVASEDGGAVLFTNSAADNDSLAAQIKNPAFILNAGKKSWFGARLKLSDITQTDCLVGLTGLDTTPIGGVGTEETGVADGIFFLKIDDATDWRFYVRKGGVTVASKTGIVVPVNATYLALGWAYNGKDEFEIYTSDTALLQPPPLGQSDRGTVQISSVAAAFATAIPTNVIGPNVMLQNGNAVARTMTLDWLLAAQER